MAKQPTEYIYVVMVKHIGKIRDSHTYVLGVFSKKQQAITEAEKEEELRGNGKYKAMYFKAPLNTPVVSGVSYKYLLN